MGAYGGYQQQTPNTYQGGTSGGGNIEMKPMKDPQTGRTVSYLPLPANWRMVNNGYGAQGFEGPNGIKVNYAPAETYFFNVDPYLAQMSGQQVANPMPLQSIYQERLVPAIQQQGGKLIKQYPLPQIAQRNKQLMQGALSRSNIQTVDIIASEWLQPNGSKSLILVSQVIMQSQVGGCWSVTLAELEAPAQVFEQAKETYL